MIVSKLRFFAYGDRGDSPEVWAFFSDSGLADGTEGDIEFCYTSFEDTIATLEGKGFNFGCSGPDVTVHPALWDAIAPHCAERGWRHKRAEIGKAAQVA